MDNAWFDEEQSFRFGVSLEVGERIGLTGLAALWVCLTPPTPIYATVLLGSVVLLHELFTRMVFTQEGRTDELFRWASCIGMTIAGIGGAILFLIGALVLGNDTAYQLIFWYVALVPIWGVKILDWYDSLTWQREPSLPPEVLDPDEAAQVCDVIQAAATFPGGTPS